MADPTPSCSTPCKQNVIQLNKRTVSVSGSSIIIRKGANANKIKEKRIFSKSKIHFLISIGEKNDKKAFFLALASKRIALFQMKKESPIAIFKLDEKIVDHGTVQVLDMERKKEGEFRVKLIIPIASHSGTVRKMQLTVHFGEVQVTKQKIKCLEEIRMENEKMKFCVDLGNDNFFGFFEDTVVKSDGLITRAEEPSTKKKKRIAVVGSKLWHGNILLATENGSIRVVRPKDDKNDSSDTLTLFSEGQCIPPYCILRCRDPSVIISNENTVIVGTQRGEIHFLNERLELRCKIDTEGGPINCLKVDENGNDFLWVGFESGELRMLFMPVSEQNGIPHNKDGDDQSTNEIPRRNNASILKRGTVYTTLIQVACKKSEKEMECQEKGCFYKTRSVLALAFHLRAIHRTTLALSGLALLCECGNESISWQHSKQCSISNFTVIRKHDFGPTRTLADKMTPKCILCEAYPMTILGYTEHLYIWHRKQLEEIGYYLKCCMCRDSTYTRHQAIKHKQKCKSRFYKLLKLDEESEKKDETEMDQTADYINQSIDGNNRNEKNF